MELLPARPIAPRWHTILTVAALVGLSLMNTSTGHSTRLGLDRDVVYAVSIGLEWVLVGFVWFGLRLRGVRLRDVVGENAWNWRAVLRDVGLALTFLLAANAVLSVGAWLMHSQPNATVRRILPHTSRDVALFLVVAASAGFCEEIVFRGYLLNQFRAMTGSTWAAVVIQAFVFGASHGYEGPKTMILLGVYGVMFGVLARWRRSLRPGMLAHALHDGVVGLVARHFM
jgi:membrane protease YdiL (CAAX protease family)